MDFNWSNGKIFYSFTKAIYYLCSMYFTSRVLQETNFSLERRRKKLNLPGCFRMEPYAPGPTESATCGLKELKQWKPEAAPIWWLLHCTLLMSRSVLDLIVSAMFILCGAVADADAVDPLILLVSFGAGGAVKTQQVTPGISNSQEKWVSCSILICSGYY